MLLSHGALLHERENTGWSPLHVASAKGHFRIAQYLVSAGANLLHSVGIWHRLKIWLSSYNMMDGNSGNVNSPAMPRYPVRSRRNTSIEFIHGWRPFNTSEGNNK